LFYTHRKNRIPESQYPSAEENVSERKINKNLPGKIEIGANIYLLLTLSSLKIVN
jgi:hypothetical protein